ncbi:hypothetical protein [Halarcobacter bivalviorum]|uniref:Uncharacterized protein n=1 Tax=Halarcobacter bivalviorum TaxID=663364 RepID=A0AAX2A744_9BACT|nr:hypothetical protein [Halarcobacter bivalviorum]AXH13312.1 hypothetical protein ABIV_2338 [Halarcobacter bivalviorum]RXK10082.1 hypothetical protein CRV05_06810 [Halarcobacter bivalviorum]
MEISTKYQTYTNYQTQSNNSTSKTQSNNDFSSALENFESYKAEKSTKADSKEEEYDEKYQLGLQRYNAFQDGGNKWFENSVFEKDQNAKNEFINYLSNLSVDDYMFLNGNFMNSFADLELIPDGKGNAITKEGSAQKNPAKEFSSIGSAINYFNDEINELIEGARKFGGDRSYIIDLLTNVKNFFKDYQSKEQEDNYKTLGSNNPPLFSKD